MSDKIDAYDNIGSLLDEAFAVSTLLALERSEWTVPSQEGIQNIGTLLQRLLGECQDHLRVLSPGKPIE